MNWHGTIVSKELLRWIWRMTHQSKNICQKNKNLEILEDYLVGVDLGEEYWRGWINNPYKPEHGSFMVHTKINQIANEVFYKRRLRR